MNYGLMIWQQTNRTGSDYFQDPGEGDTAVQRDRHRVIVHHCRSKVLVHPGRCTRAGRRRWIDRCLLHRHRRSITALPET